MRRCVAAARCVAALLLLAGCSDGTELEVLLVTDLRPGVEVAEARVAVFPDEATATEPLAEAPARMLGASDDLLEGEPVAALDGLTPGIVRVRVDLTGAAGAVIASGTLRTTITADGGRAVVRVLRGCGAVDCPEGACVGGACVDPRCGPESRAYCPPPECEADEDCPPAEGPGCLRPTCLAGACGAWPDDSLCGAGICDPSAGCPGGLDAGPGDAGPGDAGLDAGFDAGCEPVAETCNGLDDDCDDQIDDGALCPCPMQVIDGRAYLLCEDAMPYLMARQVCLGVGYDLTSIDDQAENDAVRAAAGFGNYWIGLDDRAVEGEFVWINSSTSTYRSWADGEPNGDLNENCAHERGDGTWNDTRCDQNHRFVCEAP